MKILNIAKKIKQVEKASKAYNKEDFKSFTLFCKNAEIFVDIEKVYFYTFNYIYHVCICYFNNKRERKEFTNKNDVIDLLKNFKILNMED